MRDLVPRQRAISFTSRSRSAATSISTLSMRRASPTIATGASAVGRSSTTFEARQARQRTPRRAEVMEARRGLRGRESRDLLRWRQPHLGTQVRATRLSRPSAPRRCVSAPRSIFGLLRLRVGLDHDALAALSSERRDLLPQLFGDERDDRVRETQRRFQHAHQRAPRATLLRFAAVRRAAPSRAPRTSRNTRPTRIRTRHAPPCRSGTRETRGASAPRRAAGA